MPLYRRTQRQQRSRRGSRSTSCTVARKRRRCRGGVEVFWGMHISHAAGAHKQQLPWMERTLCRFLYAACARLFFALTASFLSASVVRTSVARGLPRCRGASSPSSSPGLYKGMLTHQRKQISIQAEQ